MYVCEEFCVSFLVLFLSLCSVVHYARDCSCMLESQAGEVTMGIQKIEEPPYTKKSTE